MNKETDPGKKEALRKQFQDLARKAGNLQDIWKDIIGAFKDQSEGECKAYFNELDHMDFLQLEGAMQLQWAKSTVKAFFWTRDLISLVA